MSENQKPMKSAANENFQLKLQVDQMNRELQDCKLENEKYIEKIQELEKWIILLLNNFYQGNPQSLESIEKGLQIIDEMRNHNFQLKKALLFEKKKYNDLQESYMSLQKKMKEREEDLKKTSAGDLILQKQALEENLKLLSEEVEAVSQKNERLLNDLKCRDFYNQYNAVVEELSNLKQSHAQLIATSLSGKSNYGSNGKTIVGQRKSYAENNPNIYTMQPLNLQQQQNQNASQQMNSLLKFISCQGGCGISPNYNPNQGSLTLGTNMPIEKTDGSVYPGREDFESIINNNEVNFLSTKQQLGMNSRKPQGKQGSSSFQQFMNQQQRGGQK